MLERLSFLACRLWVQQKSFDHSWIYNIYRILTLIIFLYFIIRLPKKSISKIFYLSLVKPLTNASNICQLHTAESIAFRIYSVLSPQQVHLRVNIGSVFRLEKKGPTKLCPLYDPQSSREVNSSTSKKKTERENDNRNIVAVQTYGSSHIHATTAVKFGEASVNSNDIAPSQHTASLISA